MFMFVNNQWLKKGDVIYYFYDKQNPVELGFICDAIRSEDYEQIAIVATVSLGIVHLPSCDVFKNEQSCKAFSQSDFAYSEEHKELINRATLYGNNNPYTDIILSQLRAAEATAYLFAPASAIRKDVVRDTI